MMVNFTTNNDYNCYPPLVLSYATSIPLYSKPLILVIIAIITILGYLSWALVQQVSQKNSRDPRRWPISGSHREVSQNHHRLHDWILQFFAPDHRTIKLCIYSKTTFMTVDPANVEYILKTNFKNYPKGESAHERLYDMLGDGIFNSDGEAWSRHRKAASFSFSTKQLRDYNTSTFKNDALKLASILQNATDSNESSLDIHDLFMRMSMDSICKVGFGVEMGSLYTSHHPFADAFDKVNELVTRRFINPFWKIQKFFDIGDEKQLQRHVKKMRCFTREMVEKRTMDTNWLVGGDLLSHLINLTSKGEYTTFDTNYLCDAVLNFLIAGRDTTAITLSWFIYCICKHPEVGEKIYEETCLVISNNNDMSMEEFAKHLNYETMKGLQYLHATLTETLRLYPAIPMDGKVASTDDILPDGTRVKAGQQVAYVPYSMGRMEFLWGSNALQFKPERWLSKEDGKFQPQSPYQFTSFQAGPRTCLGKNSAYLQMKIVVALLLRFFRFQLVETNQNPVQYRLLMVLAMANGLNVHVTKRSHLATSFV